VGGHVIPIGKSEYVLENVSGGLTFQVVFGCFRNAVINGYPRLVDLGEEPVVTVV